MELNLFQKIEKKFEKVNVNEFIKEIIERLKNMEEELVIDRYEGNFAICEDRKTGNIKQIPKENIEEGLKEGSIIKLQDGKYMQDIEKQEEVEERIKEKMDNLWED